MAEKIREATLEQVLPANFQQAKRSPKSLAQVWGKFLTKAKKSKKEFYNAKISLIMIIINTNYSINLFLKGCCNQNKLKK